MKLLSETNEARNMWILGYMTVAEAAEWSGKSKYTIYRWIRNERLKSRRVGGYNTVYVLRTSLYKLYPRPKETAAEAAETAETAETTKGEPEK